MTTTDNSRADALTEKQRHAVDEAAKVLRDNWEHGTAEDLLMAFLPESSDPQPAAAPCKCSGLGPCAQLTDGSCRIEDQRMPKDLGDSLPDTGNDANALAKRVFGGLNALRWFLNLTTEFDRKDVRTRQAARLLDEFTNKHGQTNRQLLEHLWSELHALLSNDDVMECIEARPTLPAPSPADARAAFDLTDAEWLDVFERVSASIPNVFGSYMKVRAAFAREAIRLADEARAASANETGAEGAKDEAAIRKSMTSEQIQLERKLTCEAIDGAMAFGYQNTNPPPNEDHWLAPYWKIGRVQAETNLALLNVTSPLELPAKAAEACKTCGGSRVVDDGEISGSGGVEFENGPIKCVKDCPNCAAPHPAQADARVGLTIPDTTRALLLNVLWHHQGGSSEVGQPIRKILGIGEHDHLTGDQLTEAKRIERLVANEPMEDVIQRENDRLRADLKRRTDIEQGHCWYWIGDGCDELESLTCQVIIKAADLRALLAAHPGQSKPRAEVTGDDASLWRYVAQHAVVVDCSTDGMVVLTVASGADSGALELAARNAVELLAARTGASS